MLPSRAGIQIDVLVAVILVHPMRPQGGDFAGMIGRGRCSAVTT